MRSPFVFGRKFHVVVVYHFQIAVVLCYSVKSTVSKVVSNQWLKPIAGEIVNPVIGFHGNDIKVTGGYGICKLHYFVANPFCR